MGEAACAPPKRAKQLRPPSFPSKVQHSLRIGTFYCYDMEDIGEDKVSDIAIRREHKTSPEVLLPHLKSRIEAAAGPWNVPVYWRSDSLAEASGKGLTAKLWIDADTVCVEADLSFMLSFLQSTIEARASEVIEGAISARETSRFVTPEPSAQGGRCLPRRKYYPLSRSGLAGSEHCCLQVEPAAPRRASMEVLHYHGTVSYR